jgi:hypothetical protein
LLFLFKKPNEVKGEKEGKDERPDSGQEKNELLSRHERLNTPDSHPKEKKNRGRNQKNVKIN